MRQDHFKLVRNKYNPEDLKPGELYYAEEFGSALHLCACGCGITVSTPIDSKWWSLLEEENGPTLHPSIGNFQFPCRSHYMITNGAVRWF